MRPIILLLFVFFAQVGWAQTIDILRGMHNVFWVRGSINNNPMPISFLVDTGATHTTISAEVAQITGIENENCVEILNVITASGNENLCLKNIEKLEVGGFVFQNIKVYVSPKLPHPALLGNDLLHRFLIIQHGFDGQILTLSR